MFPGAGEAEDPEAQPARRSNAPDTEAAYAIRRRGEQGEEKRLNGLILKLSAAMDFELFDGSSRKKVSFARDRTSAHDAKGLFTDFDVFC